MEKATKYSVLPKEIFIPRLLAAWQAVGNKIGVGQHLQMRQLLQRIPEDAPCPALKAWLAPILAHDAQSQQEFYRIFEETLATTANALAEHEASAAQIQRRNFLQRLGRSANLRRLAAVGQWQALRRPKKKMVTMGFSLALAGLLAWSGFYFLSSPVPAESSGDAMPAVFIPVKFPGEPSAEAICFRFQDPSLGKPAEVFPASRPSGRMAIEHYFQEEYICFQYRGLSAGREELSCKACYENGECRQFSLIFLVDAFQGFMPSPRVVNGDIVFATPKAPAANPVQEIATLVQNTSPVSAQKMDTAQGIMDTAYLSYHASRPVEGVAGAAGFGGGLAYLSGAKALFLASSALLLGLLGWWVRRRRQRITLEHQPGQNPPYAWSLRIPNYSEVAMGPAFYQVLAEMRQRDAVASSRLDVGRTIESSVRRGGAIDIQFEQAGQSRQYLVLVDAAARNNHHAKIFNLLAETLQENEAPLERFFFDGNPRFCRNERWPQGLPLSKLEQYCQDCHLIICGTGHSLLYPGKSELLPWAGALMAWRRRVILTPRPPEMWDEREAALVKKFRLLPGNPHGISLLIETLEAVDPPDYEKRAHSVRKTEGYPTIWLPPGLPAEELIAFLKAEFAHVQPGEKDAVLLRWVAACALPPVLFWDWTLHVGQMLSTPGDNRLTLENLFQIARLPWFAEGRMPDEARLALLAWLEEEHPHWLLRVRQQWGNILQLEENLPPLGSIAWDGHRVEIILNELLQNPDWRRRRRLELELERLIHGKEERDVMVVRYLEKRKGALEEALSGRFRSFVQEQQGIVWHWRPWAWQLPAFLLLALATLMTNYKEQAITFKFDQYITDVVFSPDSKSVMAAYGRGGLGVCTAEGKWVQGRTEKESKIIGLSVSTDGHTIAAGTSAGQFDYWDVSGTSIYRSGGGSRLAKAVAFHPLDPFRVVVGYYDNVAEVWNLRRKGEGPALSLPHASVVEVVAFSPDGQFVLTGSRDGAARLWNQQGILLRVLEGHSGPVYAVAVSPDGRYLLTGSRDHTARLWNLADGRLAHTFDGHAYDVLDACFSPDGTKVLTGSRDYTAVLWSTATGERLRTFRGHRNYVTSVAISPDGRHALTGDRDGRVVLWAMEGQ